MDDDDTKFVAGNLLVGVHQSRAGTISLPAGWAEAGVEIQGSATTRIIFKQIAAGDPGSVPVTSTADGFEQTLTVMEFEAGPDGTAWALDQVSSRQTGLVAESTALSTGTTEVTISHPQLAVAAVAILGDPGGWDANFTNGFLLRSAVASTGTAADRSAHAAATRILDDHACVETTMAWTVRRPAAALLATFRPTSAPTDPIVFARAGIPTTDTLTVVAKAMDSNALALVVSKDEHLLDAVVSTLVDVDPERDRLVTLAVSGLTADTEYHWGIRSGGHTSPRKGRVVTAPIGAKTFTFATSGCGGYRNNTSGDQQYPMSSHPVWEAILGHKPDFFVHLGDLHYQDVKSSVEDDHIQAYIDVMSSSKQGRLWRVIPMAHMWGDHDFCGDNSYAGSAGRLAARAAYRKATPQALAWASGDNPISFAFNWGSRVRFIIPDCRSARSDPFAKDDASKTMLGNPGKAWLFGQLDAAEADSEIALIVLYLEVPWISSAGDGDDWSVCDNERVEIAAYLDAHVTTPILGLGSDAHMNAFDDGTHNVWGAFPVLQAGALARGGSIKGGPYSGGAFPNLGGEGDVGQFALVRVTDDSAGMNVEVSGRAVTRAGVESIQFTEWILVAPHR
ncbi:MAG: alkaline phosphatase D family protein [Acidimicrobiales bacterium]